MIKYGSGFACLKKTMALEESLLTFPLPKGTLSKILFLLAYFCPSIQLNSTAAAAAIDSFKSTYLFFFFFKILFLQF